MNISVGDWILGGIMALSFIATTLMVRPSRLFRYDERNPARRWCKKCGQLQEQYCRTWNWNDVWWEDEGRLYDEKCRCHKHQEYRR